MGKYSDRDVLMKAYEHSYRRTLNPHSYILIRLDGRAFHTFTRGLERPFDKRLQSTMIFTAQELCRQVQGVRAAYVQSDEISLLVTAWKEAEDFTPMLRSELPFGGVEAKILSLTASIATAAFNHRWGQEVEEASLAHFDSRLWTFQGTHQGRELVKDYFDWRRSDCMRNSVSMAAQSVFSHKELHKKGVPAMLEMLVEAGSPWTELDETFRWGAHIQKNLIEVTTLVLSPRTQHHEKLTYKRSSWDAKPATDHFDINCVPEPA